jgi:hypothetical protein
MNKPMTTNTRPSTVTVLICENPGQLCQSDNCEHPADLVVVASHSDGADFSQEECCVNHWGTIRRGFVRARWDIRYGEGAPELIVERLSTRLVSDSAGAQQ